MKTRYSNKILNIALFIVIMFVQSACATASSVPPTETSILNTSTPEPTSTPTDTPTPEATSTPRPTKTPRPTPTREPLTHNGSPCVPWTSITEKDLEKNLCVYGIIYDFGPSYDKWYTVEFSSAPDSFRVYDFNYYYLTPLHKGDCIVIYGRIRDWGPFLIISPDYKTVDTSVGVGDAMYCE